MKDMKVLWTMKRLSVVTAGRNKEMWPKKILPSLTVWKNEVWTHTFHSEQTSGHKNAHNSGDDDAQVT